MNGMHVNENATDVTRAKSAGGAPLRGWQSPGSEAMQPTNDTGASREQQRKLDRAGRRARGLGWFSVGLGVTQLVAPRALARAIGVNDGPTACLAMRGLGVRELMAGIGILGARRPTPWLWSRVLGDVMDLALLGSAFRSRPAISIKNMRQRDRIPVALIAVAGVTALDFLTSRQLRRGDARGDRAQVSQPAQIASFVTISRKPEEVYAFWRDFQNLSRFMKNVQSVEVQDQRRSRWTVDVAGKSLQWDAEITEDRPNESIAWRTLKDADVAHTGQVLFVPAPGGRGTEVRVRMEVSAPGGMLGLAAAKVGRKLPEQEIDNDLRRLKQILELGEVVNSDASIHRGPHPARPDGQGA
jgi:uncharacterized membrane protein